MRFLLAIALTTGLAGSLTLGAETLRAGAAGATIHIPDGPLMKDIGRAVLPQGG